MKLIVDWEECDGMYVSLVDVFVRSLTLLGVMRGEIVRSTPLLSHEKFLFKDRVIGEIHCREIPFENVGLLYDEPIGFSRGDYACQLYLEETFLDVFGKALLEKAIPIYAEEDFFWLYPDCETFDWRDYSVQPFLKSAEKNLRETLGLSVVGLKVSK